MAKVFVIMRGFSDSNTHESDSEPVLVCSSKSKASMMIEKFESSCIGQCWYSVYEVDFD